MTRREQEEILEAIWTCHEQNDRSLESIRKECQITITSDTLNKLEGDGVLALDKDLVLLTKEGKELATGVIRRHRLAERLLADILQMKDENLETIACEFEHSIIPEVTESICILLGHPKECPHGLPIPMGRCCKEAKQVVDEVLVSLDRLEAGEVGRVAYVRPKTHSRLHSLLSFGISPGASIRVHQKVPAYVVKLDQTELAIEKDVVKDIYVWRKNSI